MAAGAGDVTMTRIGVSVTRVEGARMPRKERGPWYPVIRGGHRRALNRAAWRAWGQLPAFDLPAAGGGRVRSWDYKSRRHLVL